MTHVTIAGVLSEHIQTVTKMLPRRRQVNVAAMPDARGKSSDRMTQHDTTHRTLRCSKWTPRVNEHKSNAAPSQGQGQQQACITVAWAPAAYEATDSQGIRHEGSASAS